MTGQLITVALIAKTPVPGRVKTRLCPPCEPDEAAAVATQLLDHAVALIASVVDDSVTPAVLLDGEPGDWIPDGWRVVPQRGDGLDERLANGFDDIGGPAIIMAMDSPEVMTCDLTSIVAALAEHDAVLGPTSDGGYWCIGLAAPNQRAVVGVPMSQPDTLYHQKIRLELLGLRYATTNTFDDIDTFQDALRVAERIPKTSIANCINTIAERHRLHAQN